MAIKYDIRLVLMISRQNSQLWNRHPFCTFYFSFKAGHCRSWFRESVLDLKSCG